MVVSDRPAVESLLFRLCLVVATLWAGICGSDVSGAGEKPSQFLLWDPLRPIPKRNELPPIEGLRFSIVKERRPEVDGYRWLHGAAIVRHKGVLYTSWGHNKGEENTVTEVVQGRRSVDDGRTWLPMEMIAPGDANFGVSHGVFLSHRDRLWAFLASFTAPRRDTKVRVYVLDERANRWDRHRIVVSEGFWPMAEPLKMDDGNWIMAGITVAGKYPAAVAISHGEDLADWEVVEIPQAEALGRMWGESAVIVQSAEVTCIARYGAQGLALASTSKDYGRTWTPMRESNLPMTPAKPYAGILSTGQRYLIGTICADAGMRRTPLSIAVSAPGRREFSKIYKIASIPKGTNLAGDQPHLSYPYAVEYDDCLYVIYSAALESGNQNNAELAIIPVDALTAD